MKRKTVPECLAAWDADKAERDRVVQYTMDELAEKYPQLTKKQVKQLFCEAVSRNIVQNEIFEMAAYIMEEE